MLEEPLAPPDPLSVRYSAKRLEWFVWDSFAEKRVSKVYATESAAEAVLTNLISRRGKR